MSDYRHLSLEERCSIAGFREAGHSIRQIAAALDRQPSTIARELKRNSGTQVGYRPGYAQERARARRWSGSRLERDDVLRQAVMVHLKKRWSPEQIAGRLALEAGRRVISHETIYRFVYAQLRRTNDRLWRHYLQRAKYKRGWRRIGGPVRFARHRTIHERPADVAARTTIGDWEADAILFSKPGQAILVTHERVSRMTLAVRATSLKAEPTAQALAGLMHPVPPHLRRTMTFDLGNEFARHHHLASQIGIETYFCDPHSPWQKGGVENAIGRLRRDIPRNTDLDDLSDEALDIVLSRYNNTPRKCLGFRTPAEAFLKPLHFKCESTPARRPG